MNMKKILTIIMAMMLLLSVAGCGNSGASDDSSNGDADKQEEQQGGSDVQEEPTSDDPVEISYATFMVGSHASATAEKEVIDAFNKEYEGKIVVTIEELPSDDAFVNKMKTLASSADLPDVIIGKNGIRELAVANGQAVNLLPLLEEDPDWKAIVGDGAIEYNMTDDGELYSIANQKQLISYFYNKDLFAQVGIEPAKTWDEFMSNNQKLKDAGITPLALMTGENSWTTNLWLAAMIGTSGEEGNDFMNTSYPDSYETPEMIEALGRIQTMLDEFTTPDAIGANYANAANNFLQEQAAMIANGPWMCPDFSDTTKATEGLQDRIGVALYPNDGLIAQYEVGYVLNTKGKSEEEQAAALEFLKFKTSQYAQEVFLEKAGALPLTSNVAITDEYKAANPIVAELINMSGDATFTFENIDNTAYSSVITEFSTRYPELAFGDITPEEMAAHLQRANELNE